MRWLRISVAVAFMLVGWLAGWAPAHAQAEQHGRLAYVIDSEGGLLLVTNAGRWLVTIDPTSCDVPQPMTQVLLSPDDSTLLLNSGEACTISKALFVDPTPCATEAHGICDLALEPRG